MEAYKKKNTGISSQGRDQEFIANTYVMRCLTVTMIVYTIVFLLNQAEIFIIKKDLMWKAFIPSVIIYLIAQLVSRKMSLSDKRTKYFILFCTIVLFTITGVYLTYHTILVLALPFLYASLYSSKRVMWFVFVMTVISATVSVYGGYYYGLCDANMVLLTSKDINDYVMDGLFVLIQANSDPLVTLALFYIAPRCLICIAIMFVCNNIVEIVSGSRKKTERMFLQTVTALGEAVDAKDRYTSGHSKRVAKYARMIAARLGMNNEEQAEVYRAGLLHDVGKIRIPEEIINKSGKLTEEEFNIIKIHPVTGYHILREISEDSIIAIAAKYHHERYDGKGYPNGLKGEEIPEVARILGVADSYDAMASNRSYRNALPQEVVRGEIEKGRGTQFDPKIADIMMQMIDEDTEYRMKEASIRKRRVLSVDDETVNNERLKEVMKDDPRYELITVESGREALQILKEQHIDLILLDEQMPKMDGRETLRRIREQYQIPVVMTGDTTLEASELKSLGCEEFIIKSMLPLLLKEVVHNLIEQTEP